MQEGEEEEREEEEEEEPPRVNETEMEVEPVQPVQPVLDRIIHPVMERVRITCME